MLKLVSLGGYMIIELSLVALAAFGGYEAYHNRAVIEADAKLELAKLRADLTKLEATVKAKV
jgi:cell division protein FtsB